VEENDLNKLVVLRQDLISEYSKLRDYKTNRNALMKEVDHAASIHSIIKRIDNILSEHVNFE